MRSPLARLSQVSSEGKYYIITISDTIYNITIYGDNDKMFLRNTEIPL